MNRESSMYHTNIYNSDIKNYIYKNHGHNSIDNRLEVLYMLIMILMIIIFLYLKKF